MKKLAAIMLTALTLFASAMVAGAAESVEVRGQVFGTDPGNWNPQNFAGFFYDIKDNLGKENLVFSPDAANPRSLPADTGIAYTTTVEPKAFDFDAWGQFNVIGFLAEKYFAGYINNETTKEDVLYEESDDDNVLADDQLNKILIDDDTERTVTSGTPLELMEGYVLAIKEIDVDGNKVYVELSKDGAVVDSKVMSPSKEGASMKDKTYYFKKTVGDSKDLVTIAVHFKNAFRGANQNLATVDGIWQISEEFVDVSADQEFDKMTTVASPNAGEIKMVNKDEAVTLSKNKDIAIMPGVNVKVADSNDIRYYIYKTITEPGDYEVRGAVFGTEPGNWNPQNFAGFFYDIKDNLGKENLVFVPDAANPRSLVADTGIAYTTTVEPKTFDFDAWGQFNVIGFLAEKYFAGYINNETTKEDVLYEESDDDNVLADDQLNKILIDDDTERTVTSGTPLELMEGYMLAIKEIDVDGNKVYVELSKDGAVVDSKVLSPSKVGATMKDKTYYFKKTVGDSKDLVTIAVHFKNAFRGANQNLATVDGIWQISEEFVDVSADQEFDKMTTVASPNAGEIKMVNKDEAVTLSKNKEISLMPGVNVKVADSNDIRYYIFKPVTIEGEATEAPAAEAKPAVEAPAAEAKPVAEAAAKAAVAEKVAEAKTAAENKTAEAHGAVKAVENKTAEAAGAAKEAASTEAKKQPGFEGIFAIAGLLAVAYLVLGRKE